MNLQLSIYTEFAHVDITLPATNNADFCVELSKQQFSLRKPIQLELEVLDHQWKFKTSSQYRVEKDGKPWEGKSIKSMDRLTIIAGTIAFSAIVTEQSEHIGAYQKFYTSALGSLTVGKTSDNDVCCDKLNIISRHHLAIRFFNASARLEDYSANGVYLNGRRVQQHAELGFGDVISLFGLKIVYLVDVIAINAEEVGGVIHSRAESARVARVDPYEERLQEELQPSELFHRAPRKMLTLHTEGEEIEAPPQKQATNRKPVWMIIGPSFTMAIPMLLGCGFMILARSLSGTANSLFMYVGLVTALSSAIIGISWALINLNYSKKEEKEAELLRLQKYGNYLMECAERIRQKYEFNRGAMLEMYPAATVCSTYWNNPQELWNRNRSHADFMTYRVGVGDVKFQVPVSVPQKHFSLSQDDLLDRTREMKQNYEILYGVPITVDLFENRVMGLIGAGREQLAKVLITQIAANNSYTDVRLIVLAREEKDTGWSFTRWLPHVWNAERTRRYVAFGKQEISEACYELAAALRSRREEADGVYSRKKVLPVQYVVVVEDVKLLESEPVTKYLLEDPGDIGVTTILLANSYEDLPNSCSFILENSSRFAGMYSMEAGTGEPTQITFDMVSDDDVEQFARKISGIRVAETGSGNDLPDSLTFFDMMGVNSLEELAVLDNWRKNRTYQTLRAMVGWKAGNAPCYLNIHEKYHGPHGLIAGTTGSGKSETLQTYILSLAINYSPKDVGFFLIDFKGGGMANLFSELPHMLGSISNLSGNQVHRAMVSIKSENTRRQRVFNEYGVNHIDAYTKLVKCGEATLPIPHLFIVIDEFAELKREEPDFMRELISVAQVGRSLGVHLILATQKPSGTVDDNIWSNTKFRLCLRVADTQDSKDMLKKADAAYLTQAGRCYLQVGNDEIYELFQSGWSGAVYDEDISSNGNTSVELLEHSGKVALSGGGAKARRKRQRKVRWIAELIDCCSAAQTGEMEESERLNSIFEQIRIRGIDYADSQFNRRQIADFLERYHKLFSLGRDKAAAVIVEQAEQTGRKLPEEKEKTQLDAVVEYLGKVASENQYSNDLCLWMPVLPEVLMLDAIPEVRSNAVRDDSWNCMSANNTLRTYVGLVDDPKNQSQFPLEIDFLQSGHLAVCGAVASGKSTLLQTMVFGLTQTYTPEMLNVYAIDYSSQMLAPFAALPHVGGVVYEGEDEKLEKLFRLLKKTLKMRKELLRGGSFTQYIAVNGNAVPAVLLVLDGYAGFREKTGNVYEENLLELARDGASLGIFLCISSGGFGSGEIPAKIGDKIRQVMCLEMDSKYSYGDCLKTMHFDVLPESGIKGRGLAMCGDSILEYQTALAFAGDDYQRGEAIRRRCEKIALLWKGSCAERIPEIPQNPIWSEFEKLDDYKKLISSERYLPLGYCRKDASIYAIDLCKTYCYLISGREKSGKSNFVRNVAFAARARGAKVYVVDKMGSTAERRTAELAGGTHVNSADGLFELWKMLILLINERHPLKLQLEEQGAEDDEIFDGMKQYEQVYVLIADLPDFIQACLNPGSGRASMGAQVENILQKGAMHQVYFCGAITTGDITATSAQGIYRAFVKGKQGVHLGGELNTQKMLSYKNIPFAEQGRSKKPGFGFVPDAEDSMNVDEIVIPLNKVAKKQINQQGMEDGHE